MTGPDQATLPAGAATLRLVDYVPAVAPGDPAHRRRLWPDILRDWPAEGVTLPPDENRSLWLTVKVPRDTAPGEYRGQVTFTPNRGPAVHFPIVLRVHDLLLPPPSSWQFRVDFWQAFGNLARAYKLTEWSEDWWAVVRTYLQDLAAHGESVVQVGRGYFDWQQDPGGQWSFDFSRFDRYVKLCHSVGIDGLIEYLQMFSGRGDTYLYYTAPDGRQEKIKANPGDPQFDAAWLAFARALAAHCRRQGWMGRLYICPTDEPQNVYGPPTLQRFRHCVELLHQADPEYKTTVALDSLASARQLAPAIDRFVFKLRADVYNPDFAHQLLAQGKLVETYICCHPDRPNSFITSPAIDQRVIGWICWREGLQGLLRWSYVNWPADVWKNPAGDGKYAPGDLFIVYPGDKRPLDSTRWERLLEGFEDNEMLRAANHAILKAADESKRKAARAAYEAALATIAGPPGKLTDYTQDPQVFARARRKLLEAVDAARTP